MKTTSKKPLTEASQEDIVTLALLFAGGDQRPVDTEDVAMEAHKLAPGMFSWRKYPEQINLELIRVVLSNAKKEGHEKRLTGSGRTGWMLSRTGLVWSRKNSKKLLRTNLDRKREQSRVGSIDEQRWRRERARVTATAAWEKWLAGNSAVTQREASEVFRIDSYAVGSMKNAKITRVLALLGEEPEIGRFLTQMAELLERQKANR
jgi:hypothetical protein